MSTERSPHSTQTARSGHPSDAGRNDARHWTRTDRLHTSFGSVVFVFCLAVIQVTQFASRPLWHTDLWDHVNYGQNILATGCIPQTEPLLPTAVNESMVSTAWGSQVLLALVVGSGKLGLPALQFIYGLLVVLAIGTIGAAVVRKSSSVLFGIFATLTFLALNWQQFLIVRPQAVGVTLFAIVLAVMATNADHRRPVRWILPVVFVIWANLHGSFAMGLLLMGLIAAGRFVDAFGRTHSLYTAFRYRPFATLMISILCCSVAVTINPNGWRVYPEVLRVGRHPNIASMYEWGAITLQMKQGRAFAVVAVLLIVTMIFTTRRRRATEWIPLIVTAALTIWSSRMINWFAPIAAYVLCLHGAAIASKFRADTGIVSYPRKRILWAVLCVGIVGGSFLLTPFGQQNLTGHLRSVRESVSSQTPVQTAQFLAGMKEVPDGTALYPAEWSGFLMHFAAQDIRPLVNLHVHVIPQQVWADYIQLLDGAPDYSAILDSYCINLVVVDKSRQGRLARQLLSDLSFSVQYEDTQAVVFVRSGQAGAD